MGLLPLKGFLGSGGLEGGVTGPFFPTSLRHLREDRGRVSGDIFL